MHFQWFPTDSAAKIFYIIFKVTFITVVNFQIETNKIHLYRSGTGNMQNSVPEVAQEAVLVQSGQLPVEPVEVKGYDFNQGIDHHKLLQSFRTSGFQATNFGLAVEEINKMVCYEKSMSV